jgi:flagellar protein FliJ
MKFDFSFQKGLEFKEKEKEVVQQEFGDIRLKQLELEEQIDGLEKTKEAVFNQYNDVNRKPVWEILEVQEEIKHINLRMEKLSHQKREITQAVEQKQQVLIEKTQEAKMWNQWKEKSKLAFQKQLDQKEQALLDEMAVLRYSRRV